MKFDNSNTGLYHSRINILQHNIYQELCSHSFPLYERHNCQLSLGLTCYCIKLSALANILQEVFLFCTCICTLNHSLYNLNLMLKMLYTLKQACRTIVTTEFCTHLSSNMTTSMAKYQKIKILSAGT